MQKQFGSAQNISLALLVITLGGYFLLGGFDLVPLSGAREVLKGPGWIMALCGGSFMLCGLLLLSRGLAPDGKFSGPLPENTPFWLRAVQYAAVVALFGVMAAVGTWIAFGPGTRVFNMSVPWFVPEAVSEQIGRLAFGAGAAITWFCAIAIAIDGARKLFGRQSAKS